MAHGEIFLQLSVRMPDDPKVRALARYGRNARPTRDLYTQMLLYCKDNLTDGVVPAEQIGILAFPDSPAAGVRDAARLAEVGLIEAVPGGWLVPGFVKRNRSRADIEERAAKKARDSAKANHTRWHAERGESKPDCEWCRDSIRPGSGPDSDPDPPTDPTPDSGPDSDPDTQPDSGTDPPTDPPTDPGTDPPTETSGIHRVIGQRQSHSQSHSNDRTPEESVRPARGAVDHHRSDRHARGREEDDQDPKTLAKADEAIEGRITALLLALTGREITPDHAAKVRKQILDGRTVDNADAYVIAAIRAAPDDFVPAGGTPADRTVAEALRDAVPTTGGEA